MFVHSSFKNKQFKVFLSSNQAESIKLNEKKIGGFYVALIIVVRVPPFGRKFRLLQTGSEFYLF